MLIIRRTKDKTYCFYNDLIFIAKSFNLDCIMPLKFSSVIFIFSDSFGLHCLLSVFTNDVEKAAVVLGIYLLNLQPPSILLHNHIFYPCRHP